MKWPIEDSSNERKTNLKPSAAGAFFENASIDKQMIRYFGYHYLKQFMGGNVCEGKSKTPEVT